MALRKRLSIGGRSEKLLIKIPPGIESGQGLRVAGKGEEGSPPAGGNQNGEKGPAGDLVVRIWVDEHALFRKEGFNLVMEMPVRLTMALTGGSVEIDTLDGPIELKIPQEIRMGRSCVSRARAFRTKQPASWATGAAAATF